jgi:hypothetical protein
MSGEQGARSWEPGGQGTSAFTLPARSRLSALISKPRAPRFVPPVFSDES